VRTRAWIAAGILAAVLASPVEAKPEDAGFHFGVSGGSVRYWYHSADYDAIARRAFDEASRPILSLNPHLDESDSALSVFGGFRFNRFIAVEGAFIDLGAVRYTADAMFLVNSTPQPGTVHVTTRERGGTVAAIGIWPITDIWELYGRAGMLLDRGEIRKTREVSGVRTSLRDTNESFDAIIGLGMAWHAGEHIAVRLEYQRIAAGFSDDSYQSSGEKSADVIGLGVLLRL
jgi:opacity protein-like surface antigen